MADFNSAWLLGKRQFQSLSGVNAEQFRRMVALLDNLSEKYATFATGL